ncbi:dihydrofolate reductase family protein [Rhodococcoides kyotonense]|uniref:Dihydrofolate reductase n=1 Tax=Rhodococcoides kyotonense TaxID=398843 RepID=A0A239ILK6_9NOCA|nr:dihydrofolate reductase family protein [Rhodococcus kyotonensis]SNS94550.1 Dihydrofolate reductase [Rhodococcus kyotonensis]
MRPLRYSINVTLDGCIDHTAVTPDPEMHQHSADIIARGDALILGRVTYQMMEGAWRNPGPEMPEWTQPFAQAIGAKRKYVVSSTLADVDWNSELMRGDLKETVQQLKQQPGDGLYVGGVTLPTALAEMGLIDEYEFIVHPRIVGHGRTLFGGLREPLDLELVGRQDFASGAVSLRYEPKR